MRRAVKVIFLLSLLSVLLAWPNALYACSVCYGESNSPMAIGLSWGIAALLGVVLMVLGGIAAFFFYLARRSAAGTPAASSHPS